MPEFAPATKPTMCFIGVTTAKSSINRLFPLWAEALGLGDCALRGLDFEVRDDPAHYRRAVEFIRRDPLSLGALVTTHKMDLCAACRDLFDELDPLSATLGEVSSIYKRNGRLFARALDQVTSGLALAAFLPEGHWRNTRAEAAILGAGGAAVGLVWHLAQGAAESNRPMRIHVAERNPSRLDHLRELHAAWNCGVPLELHLVPETRMADAIVSRLPPGSLVVNATGLGKDAPGSPLTDGARFPEKGFAWEFNYRGNLVFLDQARRQQEARHLTVEDGWTYFLHGWTRVIADVFAVEIPTSGPSFTALARLAAGARPT
jgi:shikimate 5-dehydrogenase